MISIESQLRIKDDVQVQVWGTGSSVSLSYYLFSTASCKLCLCLSRKVSPQQQKIEKIDWFRNDSLRICALRIDEIGYYVYILTVSGLLVRLPLGVFGLSQAQDQWNLMVSECNCSGESPVDKKLDERWQDISKLKEVAFVSLASLQFQNIIGLPTKKVQLQPPNRTQLECFIDAIIWQANDRKDYIVVAAQNGLIIFYSFETGLIHFGVNFAVEQTTTTPTAETIIREMKLVETQAISFLLITIGDDNVQITLQQNSKEKNASSSNPETMKNLINSYKSTAQSSIFVLPNRTGYSFFIGEEQGVIRIFYYSAAKSVLKVYRPASLRSKYSYWLPVAQASSNSSYGSSPQVNRIFQWKNYYVFWILDDSAVKVCYYLKSSLVKLSDLIGANDEIQQTAMPPLPQPLFSHEIYPRKTKVMEVGEVRELSHRTFLVEVLKNSGIDLLHIDLNRAKLALEEQMHSDAFQIVDYKQYESFLKNHAFAIEESKQILYNSLKAQSKWQHLCLIDLENKAADPFKLFHAYSAVHSPAMDSLLFRSLLSAFEKVEALDESTSAGFLLHLCLGFFRVKSTAVGEFDGSKPNPIALKSIADIINEQTRQSSEWNTSNLNPCIKPQSKFLEYIQKQEFNGRAICTKQIVDFSQFNEIFKSKRYAELMLNLISMSLSLIPRTVKLDESTQLSIDQEELASVICTQSYWLNEDYFVFKLQEAYDEECMNNFYYFKALLSLLLRSQKEGFLNELQYYLQHLNEDELVSLLNIAVQKMKMLYADTPFIGTHEIGFLLTVLETRCSTIPGESIELLLKSSLLPKPLASNVKPALDLQQCLEKIVKQRAKLTTGKRQKYLVGIDAVWMILKLTVAQVKANLEMEEEASQPANLERILPLDILDDVEVEKEESIGYNTEIEEFLKGQCVSSSPMESSADNHFIFINREPVKADRSTIILAEELMTSLQKIASNRVRKVIAPNMQLSLLISGLPI